MNTVLYYVQNLLFFLAERGFPFVEELYWREEMERLGWTEEEIDDEEDRVMAIGGSGVIAFDIRHIFIFGKKTSFWDM